MKNKLSHWFKSALVGLHALLFVGCASLSEVPKAVEPVAEHALPITGETLIKLSDTYYVLCAGEARKTAVCVQTRAVLSQAIEHYNRVNDVVLEAY